MVEFDSFGQLQQDLLVLTAQLINQMPLSASNKFYLICVRLFGVKFTGKGPILSAKIRHCCTEYRHQY